MRHLGLILAMAFMAVGAHAQGQAKQEILPVFQSEGRDPVYYSTACVSTAWTMVISSDSISRSVLVQAITANTADVCISSGPVNLNACLAGTPGDQMAPNSALTIYHRAAFYCRSVTGTQTLKGTRNRDHADAGYITLGAP